MVLLQGMVLVDGMVVVVDMVLVEGLVVDGMVVVLVEPEEIPLAMARFATLQVRAAAVRMIMVFFISFSFCF